MNRELRNVLSIFFRRIQEYSARRGSRFFLLVSFLICLAFAPWTEQRYDIYVFRLWPALMTNYGLYPLGSQLYTNGVQPPSVYPTILGYSYPPLWLYISIPIFDLWQLITRYSPPGNPSDLWIYGISVGNIAESYRSFVPSALPLLDLLLKLPSILSFVGISYLLLKLINGVTQKTEVLLLWILNPYVLHIVAVWGSFDALAAFFAFASMYLLYKKRDSFSAVLLSMGFCTKLFPGLFLIPNMIFVIKQRGSKSGLVYLSSFIVATIIVFGSFILLFPGGSEFTSSLFVGRASPNMNGTAYISGITWLTLLNVIQWNGSLPIFPLIFIPAYLALIYVFWTRTGDARSLSLHYVAILLLFYVTYTIVNPQYFLWILPFLLYLVFKKLVSRRSYLIISLIPLFWIYIHYNALYFVSPVLIWDEANYPPWSYTASLIRPTTFIILGEAILAFVISGYIFLLLTSTLRRGWKNVPRKP